MKIKKSELRELINEVLLEYHGIESDGFPKKFWVVMAPTRDSMLADIWFATDLEGFVKQIKGGLNFDRVLMVSTNKTKSKKQAEMQIDELHNSIAASGNY